MIHAFPKRGSHRWAWCYQVRRMDVTKWFGGGSASKLLKRVTCPECKRRVAAMLAVT